MFDKIGTIYPDGRLRWHGYTDEGQTVLAMNSHYLVEHMPSGGYWCNAGFVPVAAWIEVHVVKRLQRGSEPGTWQVEVEGHTIQWHPTHKRAREETLRALEENGDCWIERIAKRNENLET